MAVISPVTEQRVHHQLQVEEDVHLIEEEQVPFLFDRLILNACMDPFYASLIEFLDPVLRRRQARKTIQRAQAQLCTSTHPAVIASDFSDLESIGYSPPYSHLTNEVHIDFKKDGENDVSEYKY